MASSGLEEKMERFMAEYQPEARKAGREDGGKNTIIQYFLPNLNFNFWSNFFRSLWKR